MEPGLCCLESVVALQVKEQAPQTLKHVGSLLQPVESPVADRPRLDEEVGALL